MLQRTPSARAEFFVAAFPPPDVALALYAAFDDHRALHVGGDAWDWKGAGHLHVSLGIAGEIDVKDADLLERILETVPPKTFTARFTHCDHFLKKPRQKADRHVVWAGFDHDGDKGFRRLQAAVDAGFHAFRMTQRMRGFEPHVTVARPENRLGRAVRKTVSHYPNLRKIPAWTVESVSLMQRLPRQWQRDHNLRDRFHEVGRYSLKDGTFTRTGDVIYSADEVPAKAARLLTPA